VILNRLLTKKHNSIKLITKELEQRFAKVGEQNHTSNPIVIAKFFDPAGSATWYATEYDKETNICYGYVTGLAYDEWGSFSITELEAIQRPFGLGIERDIHFEETQFNELLKNKRLEELQKTKENKEQHLNQDIEP
jgi:hypothetical protein